MNNKTKFTLTITAMVMVTLIAVVSIIAVFAARTQNFSSSITVTYTSHEVIGTASAKWLLGGVEDAQWQDMTNGNNETTLDFSKPLDDPTLSPGEEIPLTEPEQYAIFEYNFTNEAPRPFTLNLQYTDDEVQDENVKVTTLVTPIPDGLDGIGVDEGFQIVDSIAADVIAVDNFTDIIDTVVLANSKLRIYILVKIDNIGADASFSGNFTFNLDGTAISNYDETFTYYTNGESAAITGVAKGTPVDVGTLLGGESFYITMMEDSTLAVPEQTNDGFDIKTVGAFAFAAQAGLNTIADFGQVETLGYYSFAMSGLSGQLTIPGTVKNIVGAFYQCTNITQLDIGNGVEIIDYEAFNGCTGLTGALTIPESVTTIGYRAFYDCTGLTGALTIPESVTTIGDQAFYDCTGLTSLEIKSGTIGDWAFGVLSSGTSSLASVIIGDGVKMIGNTAFIRCDALNEVTIDSEIVCDNLLNWNTYIGSELKVGGKIRAISEIQGLLNYNINLAHFTKSPSQDADGYWVYTKVANT